MQLTDQEILEQLQARKGEPAIEALSILAPNRATRRALRRKARRPDIVAKNAVQRRKARRQAGRRSAARNR